MVFKYITTFDTDTNPRGIIRSRMKGELTVVVVIAKRVRCISKVQRSRPV